MPEKVTTDSLVSRIIARGNEITETYKGASPEQIAAECGLSGPTVRSILAGKVGQWSKFQKFAMWVRENEPRYPIVKEN